MTKSKNTSEETLPATLSDEALLKALVLVISGNSALKKALFDTLKDRHAIAERLLTNVDGPAYSLELLLVREFKRLDQEAQDIFHAPGATSDPWRRILSL